MANDSLPPYDYVDDMIRLESGIADLRTQFSRVLDAIAEQATELKRIVDVIERLGETVKQMGERVDVVERYAGRLLQDVESLAARVADVQRKTSGA